MNSSLRTTPAQKAANLRTALLLGGLALAFFVGSFFFLVD